LKAIPFGREDMADLTILNENNYAIPLIPNFTTADSFIVVKKPFLEPDCDQLCLVMFQMTVANKHPIQGNKIADICRKVNNLVDGFDMETSPIYFVFVVKDTNLGNYQKQTIYKDGGKDQYKRMPKLCQRMRQFAMSVPHHVGNM
jgi:hypothetical protein